MGSSILLNGIHTPITYYHKYNRVLNKTIIKAQKDFKQKYNTLGFIDADVILNIEKEVVGDMEFNNNFVNQYFRTLSEYHDRKFDAAIKQAVNVVSITSRLSDNGIKQAIDEFIKDNVSLIKTIQKRLHDQVIDVINTNVTTTDVDRESIFNEISGRFGVAKSNAQRIARDQSSKFIANLTELRHKQVGIYQYRWLGADDSRERPTHVANNDKTFMYAQPPSATGNPGNDVNCRCVALGVLTQNMINSLKRL